MDRDLECIVGLDMVEVMAEKLRQELIKEYILTLVECYPELFCLRDNDQLFFTKKYHPIYDSELKIDRRTYDVGIKPMKSDIDFQFRLSLPSEKEYNIPKCIWVSPKYVLSDDLCIGLYEMNIDIHGYERQAIIRRHTIKNIIK